MADIMIHRGSSQIGGCCTQISTGESRILIDFSRYGKSESQGGLPSLLGRTNPPDGRKEGLPMYVTYEDLIQIGIFIVTLIGLCYTVFKGKK